VWQALMLVTMLLAGCSRVQDSAPAAAADSSPALTRDQNRIVVPADSPRLRQIRVAAVECKEIPLEEVTAPGKLEVNPNRISRVLMPVAGRIRQVLVRLGDSVAERQPVLTIDSPEAAAAMRAQTQAQAQLRQARAALAKAEKDLSRLRDLYEHRAAALKDVVSAENDLAQAQSAVEQAQAGLDEASRRLDVLGLQAGARSYEITASAPISGKVLEIAVAPGEYRNDTSASLMTIADLSTVWVTSNVPESSIRLIQTGERIEIELAAYPGEVFHGNVKRIADTVDPQTRTVKVQAELENRSGRLRPEMFGKIRHSHGSQTLPVVPASAVVQGEGGAAVFVERRAGEFERVRVRIGEIRGGLIPALSGLKAGDRVVVDGAILLKAS
jgi:cobalt-zinc-cadmium efflux system membrane fusion protein